MSTTIEDRFGNTTPAVGPSFDVGLYIGSFTRDLTLASGDVSYTGVGFRPRAIVFLASGVAGYALGGVGLDDGTTHIGLLSQFGSSITSILSGFSIGVGASGSAFQKATVASFGDDGFTLSWTKTGAPTGTATIGYIALG